MSTVVVTQTSQLSRLNRHSIWLAIRPKTLTAALVPLVVSASLVYALGFVIDWQVIFLAGGASFLIQIATNLLNDAIDFKKGADTAERIGPTRVTQSGLMSQNSVMLIGLFCLLGALLLGIPLFIKGGWPILVIGLFSLFLAYGYTGGPWPLAYKGFGDLFVILFFGVIAVTGLVYLQIDQWPLPAVIAGLQVGFLATVLIAVNNARDIEGDRRANKLTLAARWGVRFARFEILGLFVLAFALNFYWSFAFGWWFVWITLLAVPAAQSTLQIIFKNQPSAIYNQALVKAAKCHLLFGILLSIGMGTRLWFS